MMRRHFALLVFPLVLCLTLFPEPQPSSAQQGDSEDEMHEANKAASVLLLERMKRDRPADYGCLTRIRRSDILVVSGSYDHVEWVLKEIGTPFGTVSPDALSRRGLAGIRAVLVNCPGMLPEDGVRMLGDFVRDGGFLFTTDWAVLHVLERAFPKTIRYTRRPTKDDVVGIEVLRPEHLFLKHVLTANDRHLWWLESQSYPIEILDRRRVDVLIESEEMKRKYGAAPIAVTFPAGKGRVVHIVSHFYLQRSELRTKRDKLKAGGFAEDLEFAPNSPAVRRLTRGGLADVPAGKIRSAYSAQQLLANLLIEATRKSAAPKPPPPPPPPPPPVRPPEQVAGASAARATVLRKDPGGEPVKAIPKGLRLRIIETRGNWLRVATPAGETGWIRHDAVK
jgi:hypothetical protein